MGKSKKTTSNKVDPWVPSQGEFNKFKKYGGQLITSQFKQGLKDADRSLDKAARVAGVDPRVNRLYSQQMRSAGGRDGIFNRETAQAAKAGVSRGLGRAASQLQTAKLDPRFERATRNAQSPQYAQGFQSTLQEMQDPNARSDAFNQVKRNVADSVLQDVNSTFGASGMTGSSLHQQNLAKGLTSGIASVENDAFQQSQQRALQAAQIGQSDLQQQRAFGMGAAQSRQDAQSNLRSQALQGAQAYEGASQARAAQGLQAAGMRQDAYNQGQQRAFNAAQAAQGARQQQFGNLMGLSSQQAGLGQQYQGAYQGAVQGMMGNAMGGASQTTTQSQSPGLMGILGAGLQVASLFSDERLKTDKKKVGKLDDGTPVYTYKYKDGAAPEGLEGKTLMGVMAQQVKNKKAVEDDPSGFKRVDYGVL